MARLLKRAEENARCVRARRKRVPRSPFLSRSIKAFAWYAGILALACAVLLMAGDPSQSGWLPGCLFYRTTGLLCYGCGSKRALHALLHGHWADSLRYNALLVPTLVWLGTLFFIRDRTVFMRVLFTGVAALVLFTVVRNIALM